jgi:putative drug exporter of the RND superfamily
MVTGILYGLAMDYQVFLVSSMREAHAQGLPPRRAIVHGFEQPRRRRRRGHHGHGVRQLHLQ